MTISFFSPEKDINKGDTYKVEAPQHLAQMSDIEKAQ